MVLLDLAEFKSRVINHLGASIYVAKMRDCIQDELSNINCIIFFYTLPITFYPNDHLFQC